MASYEPLKPNYKPRHVRQPVFTDMHYRRGGYVDVPIPDGAMTGDLLVVMGSAVGFPGEQPILINSAGWETIVYSTVTRESSTVIGWRYHNGNIESVRLRAGTTGSNIYIVGGAVAALPSSTMGAVERASSPHGGGGSISLTDGEQQGRLIYGGASPLNTGPGVVQGGSQASKLIISDGNPPSGTWRFAASVMWDAEGTDEEYTFDTNSNGSWDLTIMEIGKRRRRK